MFFHSSIVIESPTIFIRNVVGLTILESTFIGGWGCLTVDDCDVGLVQDCSFYGPVSIDQFSSLRIDNCTFINEYGDDYSFLHISNSIGLLLSWCNFDIAHVRLRSCHSSTILNCVITLSRTSRTYGLRVENSPGLTITGLNVTKGNNGIELRNSDNSSISNITIVHSSINGLSVYDTDNLTISNASIHTSNDDGIDVRRCTEIAVTHCNISDNSAIGLNLYDTSNSIVYGNIFSNNGEYNAYDDVGQLNQFDDGISIGNNWDDYDGTGYYLISGSSESVDRFPVRYSSYPTTTGLTTTTATTNSTTTQGFLLDPVFLVIDVMAVTVILSVLFLIWRKQSK